MPATTPAIRLFSVAAALAAASLVQPQAAAAQSSETLSRTATALTLVEAPAGAVAPVLVHDSRVSQDVTSRYPGWIDWSAKTYRAEFFLQVDAQGRVADIRLAESSGHRLVDRVLREVASGMRFAPATLDGGPVDAWVRLPVVVEGN
jgi:periplasmic protein TonB